MATGKDVEDSSRRTSGASAKEHLPGGFVETARGNEYLAFPDE